MSPATQRATGKRSRISAASAEDDDIHSDDEVRTDETATRPAQAERKRELERNRRNLVNVRFLELDAEIRRCTPPVDDTASPLRSEPTTKCRRIDKEAVLKEAAQRLAVQRKEITANTHRLSNMTDEIDNLRAEKVELRSDKSYLRNELETVRGDLQRLRSDNIQLWQALKKQNSIKNVLASDVAKIPAELFLRDKNLEQSALLPVTSGAVVGHNAALAALQRQSASLQSSALSHHAPTHLPRQGNNDLTQQPSRNLQGDAYLVYQSPEELGELFTTYVPGSLTGFERVDPILPSNTHTNIPQQRQSANEAQANVISQGLNGVANLATAQAALDYEGNQPPPTTINKLPDIAVAATPRSEDPEGRGQDLFSDVAYCP